MSDYIPDPIEIMNNHIEKMIENYDENVCMSCGKKVDYELIMAYSTPDSPAVCYDCLDPYQQKQYDKFEKHLEDRHQKQNKNLPF